MFQVQNRGSQQVGNDPKVGPEVCYSGCVLGGMGGFVENNLSLRRS